MNRVFLGRQAIFDRRLRVCAHELLFRSGATTGAGLLDDTQATASVIVNAFVEFDIERIIGPNRAFINVDRDFLLDARPVPLPRSRVVLEVLETVTVDDELVAAVRALRASGFGIALDDFVFDPAWEPLLDLAHIVKVDVRAMPLDVLRAKVEGLRRRPLELLAEKVETHDEYEALRELGFHYFQGYFLERPQVMQGRQVPIGRLQAIRLLAELTKADPDIARVELLIGQDANLSHKLLRSVNSAMFALPQRVTSLRQAIRLLGTTAIARWASMVALSSLSDKPSELLQKALVRARTCELIAQAAGERSPDTYFTVGLLSTLDALLEMEMAQALADLPLGDDVTGALVRRDGALGQALACAVASERWQLDALHFKSLGPLEINAAFAEALAWSMEASGMVAQAA